MLTDSFLQSLDCSAIVSAATAALKQVNNVALRGSWQNVLPAEVERCPRCEGTDHTAPMNGFPSSLLKFVLKSRRWCSKPRHTNENWLKFWAKNRWIKVEGFLDLTLNNRDRYQFSLRIALTRAISSSKCWGEQILFACSTRDLTTASFWLGQLKPSWWEVIFFETSMS